MTHITKHTVFSELLTSQIHLIPVINRFGIGLGLGDKTIVAVCKENNINVYFFVTILRLYIDKNLCVDDDYCLFDVSDVLDYVKVTIDNLTQSSIPNIEKHFSPLIAMGNGDNEELKMLHNILYKFKTEFDNHYNQGLEHMTEYPYDLLHDLKNILIKHISGNYNHNLAYAVIFSIDLLENELLVLNNIFNLLVRPKLEELDSVNIENLSQIFSEEHKYVGGECQLTNREVEVLKLIVQGNTNKETANKLNISLNTVLSHRKNIISKTRVKTISGLTFYAISNGHVSTGMFKI